MAKSEGVAEAATPARGYETGDVVAEFDRSGRDELLARRLQGAVDKWRLLEVLSALETSGVPALSLHDGDRVYRDAESVTFSIESKHHSNVTLFNLAYDGTVQHIAPVPRARSELYTGRLQIGRPASETLTVAPPFGADHLVAIPTRADLPAFADAVFAADGRREGAGLARDLTEVLHGQEFGVDRVGIFTRPRGDGG